VAVSTPWGVCKNIAGKIVQKKAGDVLALKDNPPQRIEDVKLRPDSKRDTQLHHP